MPKINIDERIQLSEAIEIILEGKTYLITKIDTAAMKKADEIQKKGVADKSIDGPILQLAMFTGVDPSEFEGVDIRKVGAALLAIMEAVEAGLKAKNPQAAA
jgi:hypothetical protein